MTPRLRAFFFGGLAGVLAIVIQRLFHVLSPVLSALLIPGAFITAPYQGESPWIKGTLAAVLEFAFNFAIYGAVALCIVWLVNSAASRRPRD